MRNILAVFLVTLLSYSTVQSLKTVSPPQGFVGQHNGQFQLNGKPFNFVGANSYWLPLLTSTADVDSTFKQMQSQGVKVLRTWGFNAINGSELVGAQQSGLTYYQVWNSAEWVLNEGPQGLQRLDYVVNTAGKYGIKLIIAFTNNWVGYGGMELYINWIAGAGNTHDVFYTNPQIIASYQRYVTTIVNRYKNSPNVFAWEMMNEARCLGDLSAGPNCVPGTELLTKWYNETSNFIRSLDPFHMITTGGEGHFYWKNKNVGFWFDGVFNSDYNFNGQAGEDFDTELTLPNVDFGTYHLYPQTWYPQLDFPGSNFTVQDWGLLWIQLHADAAKKANKPLILEEFGLTGLQNKTEIYPQWVNLALKTNHAIFAWQFGALGLDEDGGNRPIKYADALINGASPNDGYAIYQNQTVVWNIFA
ncbi:glycoside hydrolase family 5 protein [Hypholoma sublateritium FD-334 SS-4]|uniref:mannan endo-1,4-beta-mannosidase n=1 Tax=Hypholoma sublateritium (strain FD-334 SS-4) TaxID=945553 RepID=A0A0D2PEG6_HYPSF|nr:glycoside hydrolase family 5 protein [Hypholoma sublateritium FD-334 SS-4]